MNLAWYPDEFSTLYVLLVLFVIAGIIQLYYYLFVFLRLVRFRGNDHAENPPPVSVIICARNEEDTLAKHLPVFLEQDYPEYEVIVVNHSSHDDTQGLLNEMKGRYNHLKVIEIREEGGVHLGKKYPLTMGLKGAKYEHVLLSDADCFPVSRKWLATMARNFTPHTEVVLGYGGFKKERGLLNRLIRFDTFFIALQYLSFALDKMPYMGVGRNLGYRKDLFFKNKGFGKHYMLPSGDDDLFINRVATWHNTVIETDRESHTRSIPMMSFGSWWNQKLRHLTTGKYYKSRHKFHLTAIFLSTWMFLVLFIILLSFGYAPYIIIPIFLVRYTIQIITFKHSMSRLGEKDLLGGALFFELVLVLIYPFMALGARIRKLRKWN